MPCLDASGAPTHVAAQLLHALEDGAPHDPAAIARTAQLPLYRVRAGLRELVVEDLAAPGGPEAFHITDKGRALLAR